MAEPRYVVIWCGLVWKVFRYESEAINKVFAMRRAGLSGAYYEIE